MDVRCPQCGTLFEFDERLMSGPSATLKCSVCAHLFRLERARSPQIEPEHAAAGAQGRWMLRRVSGEGSSYFRNFEELYRAIMRGEVQERDQLSRTGLKWTVLADVGEFMPVFEAARAISVAAQPSPHPHDEPLTSEVAAPPAEQRLRTSTRLQFDTTPPGDQELPKSQPVPQLDPSDPPEEWSMGGLGLEAPASSSSDSFDDIAPVSGRSALMVCFALVVLLAAGAAVVAVFAPEALEPLGLGGAGESERRASQMEAKASTPEAVSERSEELLAASGAVEQALGSSTTALASALLVAQQVSKSAGDKTGQQELSEEEEREPDIAQLLRRARRAQDGGRSRSAKRLFKDVLAQQPRNVKAISGLGWSLMDSGEFSEAIQQFERAIGIDARYEDAYIGLGAAERRLGNKRAALSTYERYLEAFPSGQSASIARHQRDELRQALGI